MRTPAWPSRSTPAPSTMEAMVVSALNSADLAQKFGLRPDQIILSAKLAACRTSSTCTGALASRCNYPLHLGLTEAGMGAKGVVASSAAMGVVLQEGIGDTIRVSLTQLRRRPHRRSPRGAADSAIHRHSQLHATGYGLPRLRTHYQHIFPGDGAADSDLSARPDAHLERPAM